MSSLSSTEEQSKSAARLTESRSIDYIPDGERHGHPFSGMSFFSAIIVVIAVLGYRVIHKLGKVASIVGVLAFAWLFASLLLNTDLSVIMQNNHFSLPMFLLAVSFSSSWQIAFCPYVSD